MGDKDTVGLGVGGDNEEGGIYYMNHICVLLIFSLNIHMIKNMLMFIQVLVVGMIHMWGTMIQWDLVLVGIMKKEVFTI